MAKRREDSSADSCRDLEEGDARPCDAGLGFKRERALVLCLGRDQIHPGIISEADQLATLCSASKQPPFGPSSRPSSSCSDCAISTRLQLLTVLGGAAGVTQAAVSRCAEMATAGKAVELLRAQAYLWGVDW